MTLREYLASVPWEPSLLEMVMSKKDSRIVRSTRTPRPLPRDVASALVEMREKYILSLLREHRRLRLPVAYIQAMVGRKFARHILDAGRVRKLINRVHQKRSRQDLTDPEKRCLVKLLMAEEGFGDLFTPWVNQLNQELSAPLKITRTRQRKRGDSHGRQDEGGGGGSREDGSPQEGRNEESCDQEGRCEDDVREEGGVGSHVMSSMLKMA